jgi:acetyl-CoA carboxylase biotin carboxyl carrier protein
MDDAPDAITEISISESGGAQITVKRRRARPTPQSAPSAADAVVADAGMWAESAPDRTDTAPADRAESTFHVNANRVGIFHAVRPEIPVGEAVSEGQIVGYIESMKLMNEIRVEQSGRIEKLLVDDGVPVEFGQPILLMNA